MIIEGTTYGTIQNGERVDIVTVTNSNNISFSAISYGATLISVKMPDQNGAIDEITLGKADLQSYEAGHPYFGSTIGRVCNRIAGAAFTMNGKEYKLNANNGPNCLHGGPGGFDKQIWDIFPFNENDKAGVRFSYVSKDGEEGFPGTLEISAVYTLTEKNELILDYEAITDKATPINITNHTYWNLAGGGAILDHRLKLNCDSYLPVNEVQIPTGEILKTAGTPFDFQTEKRIGDDIDAAGGYDHNWVKASYNENSDGLGSAEAAAAAGSSEPFAVLTEPSSGRCLEFRTSQPGVQFYTGNFLNNESGRNGIYGKHSGLCLETQNFPDAPNRKDFPSPVLNPGEKYVHSTVIRFLNT